MILSIYIIVEKSHEKTKTTYTSSIILSSIICVAGALLAYSTVPKSFIVQILTPASEKTTFKTLET